MMKRRGLFLAIVLLIALEQGIKVIINNNYLGFNAPLIEPWLYFRPIFNRDYSWINSMLQLGVGKWTHILAVVVILILAVCFYLSLNKKSISSILIDTAFAFLIAGGMCSLIDKIFWDGSLDYIQLRGFFTFDLKDVYINIFNGILILMFVIDYKGLRKGTTIE